MDDFFIPFLCDSRHVSKKRKLSESDELWVKPAHTAGAQRG